VSTVVIGAGLAGLSAARRLKAHGEDVVLLEAKEHFGGRTQSDRERLQYGQPADLGASFIDVGQDKILELCKAFDIKLTPMLELLPADPDGVHSAASLLRGKPVVVGDLVLTEESQNQIADEIRAALDALPPTPGEVIPGWAARAGLSPLARRMLVAQTGFNPVSEPSRIPMAMIQPPHSGRVCWMLAHGTDTVAWALADGLEIRMKQPVREVRRSGRSVIVRTDRDELRVDDVVVTTPIHPTLRIAFDPVLPEWKINALLSTPVSQGGKFVGQYKGGSAIIDQLGSRGAVSDGPVSMIWARPLGPEDSVVVLGLGADHGDGLLHDEQRALAALDATLGAATGLEVERLAGVVKNWSQDEFAGGVVSCLLGDFPRLPSLLGQSVGAVHFAGEHTADRWASGMDGAISSGERAADRIVERRRLRLSAS
jgi:monoamine oxidase